MPEQNRGGDDQQNWGKYLGFGMEVAVGVAVGFFVGQWLDKRYGWNPWGVMIGTMIGMAAGMYPLIRAGLNENKD